MYHKNLSFFICIVAIFISFSAQSTTEEAKKWYDRLVAASKTLSYMQRLTVENINIPPSDIDDVVKRAQRLVGVHIGVGKSLYKTARVVREIAAMPRGERDDIIERAIKLVGFNREAYAEDALSLTMQAIRRIPREERDSVIRAAKEATDVDDMDYVGNLIVAISRIPSAEREEILRMAFSLGMSDIKSDGSRADLIEYLTRISANRRQAVVERALADIAAAPRDTIPSDPQSRTRWIIAFLRLRNQLDNAASVPSMEVHNYAQALVSVPASEQSCKTDAKDKKLNDAIEDLLKSKLHENAIVVEIDLKEVERLLNQSIDRAFTSPLSPQETGVAKKLREQQDSEKKAGARRALKELLKMHQADQYLPLVITFLRRVHPGNESLDLWTSQSLGESTEAYGQNTLSCQRGIKERVFTGLRGIDKDIDELVSPVEARFLARSIIDSSANVSDPKTAKKIAERIIGEGYSKSTKKTEALAMYKKYLQEQIGSIRKNVSNYAKEYEEEVKAALEIIDDNFDDILKPILDELLTQEGSRSSSPRASVARGRSPSPQARASGRSRSPSPVLLGGVTGERFEKTKKIVQAQDTAYNESLRKDEEKRRKKQLEEEQRQREIAERAGSAASTAEPASRPMTQEERESLRMRRLERFSTNTDKAPKKPS